MDDRVGFIYQELHVQMMYKISPVQWAKSLRYRSEFLGWFIAAMLFALLAHLLVVAGVVGVSLGMVPLYAMLFLGALNFASVTAIAYSSTRMLAPVESIREFWRTNRRIVIGILASCLLLIQIAGVIAVWILNFSQTKIGPLAWLMLLFYYTLAFAAGYDSARTRNIRDRQKAENRSEVEYSSFFKSIQGKSKKKALAAGIGLLLITTIVALFTSVITGLTTAASIVAILDFLIWLYPEE